MVISNHIYLHGITDEQKEVIKKTLTLPNPMYWKLKNMGKWVGATPKEFKYYEEIEDTLVVPRGLVERNKKFLSGIKIIDTTLYKENPLASWLPDIKLRDYQEKIIASWRTQNKKEGVFNLGTGTGKSILALQLIKEIGLTATILVPTNIILNQFVSEAKKHWGYDLGVINGEQKVIREVTVVCVPSLFGNPELLKELVANTSVLIVDECSGFVSDRRCEVVEEFNASHVYGLTATPEREDGQTKAIFFYFGDIIEEYEMTAVDPTVEVIDSRVFIPIKVNYAEMIDEMIRNDSRNKLISGLALGEMLKGRKVLILTKRIEHYKELRKRLPDGDGIITADSGDDTLADQLEDLRQNKRDFNCIIGTFSLLGTGFNIEKLDTLIIAGDLRSSILTTQSAGRILRLLKDKTAKIIDIWDKDNGMLSRQFNHRKKLYETKGWKVKMPWD